MELGDAFDVRIASGTRCADTLGLMVPGDAGSCFCAGFVVTSRSADSVQPITSLVIRTIFVVVTDRGYTCDARVSLSSLRTSAVSSVVSDSALGSSTTHDVAITWVGTEAFLTGLVIRTVVVYPTFRLEALILWVSGVTLRTVTSWMMSYRDAVSVEPTPVARARILTLLVDTSKIVGTIRVAGTFRKC